MYLSNVNVQINVKTNKSVTQNYLDYPPIWCDGLEWLDFRVDSISMEAFWGFIKAERWIEGVMEEKCTIWPINYVARDYSMGQSNDLIFQFIVPRYVAPIDGPRPSAVLRLRSRLCHRTASSGVILEPNGSGVGLLGSGWAASDCRLGGREWQRDGTQP